MELEAAIACTKRTMESINGLDQRDVKGATRDCFIFDSWFAPKRLAEAVVDVGADMIGMIKKQHKIIM